MAITPTTKQMKKTLFLCIKKKNPPQIAIWIEDADGQYLGTLYASKKIATQSWASAGGNRRKETLPYWCYRQQPGRNLPSPWPQHRKRQSHSFLWLAFFVHHQHTLRLYARRQFCNLLVFNTIKFCVVDKIFFHAKSEK